MVYDCFTFFNELELLEIRLHELRNAVDVFVLVESDITFQGNPKPLYFEQNRDGFKEFLDRIIHIVVTDTPAAGSWQREWHQRNAISRGLTAACKSDIILIGDVDEIPRSAAVQRMKDTELPAAFEQKLYYYYLNVLFGPCRATVAVRPGGFGSVQEVRNNRDHVRPILDGGWHFSYLGGPERVADKIRSFAHADVNQPRFTDLERIQERMARLQDPFDREGFRYQRVAVDESFPAYVRSNLGRFRHFIREE